MMNRRSFGRTGENSAATYLEKKGFTIIGRNIYVGRDELDIIAKTDTHIVFAEVKTRRMYPGEAARFGRPGDSVDFRKRQCLISAAAGYLREHAELCERLVPRIDVIEVYIDPKSDIYKVLRINHFENEVHR